MRVLLVYDHLDMGNAQTHSLALAQALLMAEHTLFIAARGVSAGVVPSILNSLILFTPSAQNFRDQYGFYLISLLVSL